MAALRTRSTRLVVALAAAAALALPVVGSDASVAAPGTPTASGAPAVPIPQDPGADSVKAFLGAPRRAHPIHARFAPRHPFMAANGRSNHGGQRTQ